MRAADDDAFLVRHHRGERLRTTNQRNALLVGRLIGHIARLDRAGVDHHVAVLDLLLRVTVEELQPELLQAVGFQRGGLVRAADLVPEPSSSSASPLMPLPATPMRSMRMGDGFL
jgi:hypothetical protein